jgi:hypothetical protein
MFSLRITAEDGDKVQKGYHKQWGQGAQGVQCLYPFSLLNDSVASGGTQWKENHCFDPTTTTSDWKER